MLGLIRQQYPKDSFSVFDAFGEFVLAPRTFVCLFTDQETGHAGVLETGIN